MRLRSRLLPLAFSALLPLMSAGCGGGEPEAPPRTFAAPNYAYLTKLRLNVGEVTVEDHSPPPGGDAQYGGEDVSFQSPVPPVSALRQMASDRLFPAGTANRAVFVIDQARIVRASNGALSGVLAVHLELFTAAGTRGGYAEARVARQYVPGSDSQDFRSTLYDLTNQMMSEMNVEIEFQVRRSLRDWLVADAGVPLPVQAQPLQPQSPSQAPLGSPSQPPPQSQPMAPAFPPPPEFGAPPVPEAAPQMSPPPGYLQAPPGY